MFEIGGGGGEGDGAEVAGGGVGREVAGGTGGGGGGAALLAGGGGGGAGDEGWTWGSFGGSWGGAAGLVVRGGGGGGPGGAGLRLGGAGGADTFRSPWKGGGTPNRDVLSSTGVFGGRGGGGGAAFAPELARGRVEGAGLRPWEYLPASAIGGGARNLGRGGDGSRGDGEAESSCASGRALRDGGGGGGAPRRLPELLPVL